MAITTKTVADLAYFCPECGAASVEFSELAGGAASCKVCGWKGPREKLIGHVFQHDQGSGMEAFQNMLNDMRKVYAQAAPQIGAFLLKWGFADETAGKLNVRQLSRYVAAMAREALKALILERQKMEQEKHDGQSGN